MHPPTDQDPLVHLVRSADADLSATGVDGAILRISDLAPVSESFTWFPLDGAHPLEVLLGFVAPPHWRALGVSCGGRAQRRQDADRQAERDADQGREQGVEAQRRR